MEIVEVVHGYVKKYVDDALTSVTKFVREREAAIREAFADAIKTIPAGPQGECGEKGETGAQGEAGPQGERGANGSDGSQGEQGIAGEKGADGINGKDGSPGVDGKSVTTDDFRQMFEAEYAKWQLDFERRANEVVQRYLEKIPKPLDGKDGMGFDDFNIDFDGERAVTFVMSRADESKEWKFEIPSLIERGVFKRGDTYQRGDGVTHGGSFWIAQATTDQAPGEGSTLWRLAVKRGRDGKTA